MKTLSVGIALSFAFLNLFFTEAGSAVESAVCKSTAEEVGRKLYFIQDKNPSDTLAELDFSVQFEKFGKDTIWEYPLESWLVSGSYKDGRRVLLPVLRVVFLADSEGHCSFKGARYVQFGITSFGDKGFLELLSGL